MALRIIPVMSDDLTGAANVATEFARGRAGLLMVPKPGGFGPTDSWRKACGAMDGLISTRKPG